MIDMHWVMLAFIAITFGVMNFLNVRSRKRQQEEASEPVESVKATKAVSLTKKGMNINEAATPEVLSKKRHSKGW